MVIMARDEGCGFHFAFDKLVWQAQGNEMDIRKQNTLPNKFIVASMTTYFSSQPC